VWGWELKQVVEHIMTHTRQNQHEFNKYNYQM
jgi:hypothetical protein